MDDLEIQLRTLTEKLVKKLNDSNSIEETIAQWGEQQNVLVNRWKQMVTELQTGGHTDFAVFSVALRELRDLCEA